MFSVPPAAFLSDSLTEREVHRSIHEDAGGSSEWAYGGLEVTPAAVPSKGMEHPAERMLSYGPTIPARLSPLFDIICKTGSVEPHGHSPYPGMLCWKEVGMMQVYFNGRKFKAVRKHRKLSQICLAEQAETTERYLRDLEHGRKDNPSAAMVYRLSYALQIHMEDLMLVREDEE